MAIQDSHIFSQIWSQLKKFIKKYNSNLQTQNSNVAHFRQEQFYHYYMIQPRLTTLTDFVPLEKLGTGSFSTVYKVRRLSDSKIYALKKVRLSNLKEKEKENAVNQIRILASLNSSYVIGYKEALFQEKHNLLCIVMEYADGGDLHKSIDKAQKQQIKIPQNDVWKAAIHILKGLEILHSNNILHRDLKSANVFLSSNCYKLGDLNVSKVKKGHMAYTQTGTPYYASPQVWNDRPYDQKSDIWSFGCILYEMCSLNPPFQGKDMKQLNKSIQKCKYSRIPSFYSKNLEDVITMCLQKNPILRPSAQQLLNHRLLKNFVQLFSQKQDNNLKKANLLGTIRMPMNSKQFQLNLPKSKYQIQNQEDNSHKQYTEVQNCIITPKNHIQQKVRLSQIISSRRYKPTVHSERVDTSIMDQNKSIQQQNKNQKKHVSSQSKEVINMIKEKHRQRSITSLPRTQRSSAKSSCKHIADEFEPVKHAIRINSDRIQPMSEQKRYKPESILQNPLKYFSDNKAKNKKSQQQQCKNVCKKYQERDISPLLQRLQMNCELKRVEEFKNKYVGQKERNPVMKRLQAKLQKYSQPNKIQVKRYSVMPSWW